MNRYLAAALALSMPVAACESLDGGTDVAGLIGSQFVLVSLDEGDVAGGALTGQGAVNPDTYLANIRAQLGRYPTSVDLMSVRLEVGPGVEGVSQWTDLYTGEVTVFLVPQSGAPIAVAKVTPTAGLGRLTGSVIADREDLDRSADIAAGRFSVQLSGPSARSDASAFKVPVRVELEMLVF